MLFIRVTAHAADAPDRPWNQDLVYFVMTDRFYDGDKENDQPAGSDPKLSDPEQKDVDKYQGGDLRGLEIALKEGYFNDLGVTAIWITPPVRNVWYSGVDLKGPKTGYHGYWAQDFLDIDPHLVSRKSLDGKQEYPDSREGRLEHYRDFVALAHRHGIKVIQDIVCNHAGPVFYYDANGNGEFDLDEKKEWQEPFNEKGRYDNAHWADIPKWDMEKTAPGKSLKLLGSEVKLSGAFANLESYGRKGMSDDSLGKSNGEEVVCDFFSLRDFWTKPGSPTFDDLVNDFVATYAFYVDTIGVDGFRIDTVKHVHHEFWDAFTQRLREKVGPEKAKHLILFGEVYDGAPAKMGAYTYRMDWPKEKQPCLDSLLNFQFCFAARSYLRTEDKPFGKANEVEAAFRALLPVTPAGARHPYYNPEPGLDGLSSEQKMVNFVENHDGLNRFRVQGISARRNLLANALLLTAPGIPCLYYATETALEDAKGKVGADSETGRLTFVGKDNPATLSAARKNPAFIGIATLAAVRKRLPALTAGKGNPLWTDSSESELDDGIFAFARYGAGLDPVIVVINASEKDRSTGTLGHPMSLVTAEGESLLTPGDRLERVPLPGFDTPNDSAEAVEIGWKDDKIPQVLLHIPPESVRIYRRTNR
ncbi:MAG: alpha-amylase family glycosyl hydrolase [Chthoniobacterales bacterium]